MAQPTGTDEIVRKEWLGILLGSYDGGLLELELGVDGQYFFDNIDELLTTDTTYSAPDEIDVEDALDAATVKEEAAGVCGALASPLDPSVSFCALLQEAQAAANRENVEAAQGKTQPATTPHTRTRKPRGGAKTTVAKARNSPQTSMKLRSALRPRQVNRRLF